MESFLSNVSTLRLTTLLKKKLNFSEHFFYRTPPATAAARVLRVSHHGSKTAQKGREKPTLILQLFHVYCKDL